MVIWGEGMFKAQVTSKGQVTIPKQVRNFLTIDAGDSLIFKINEADKIITIEKDYTKINCPICAGEGRIEDGECFVCNGLGKINKNITAWEELGNIVATGEKYGISVTIFQDVLPRVAINSLDYSQEMLDRIEDYFLLRFLQDCVRNSKELIGDPLELFNTNEGMEVAKKILHASVGQE